jgi:hypothetical protein
MATSIFNLSAVDRIESLCNLIHGDTQAILKSEAAQDLTLTAMQQVLWAQQSALTMLAKTINDFVNALGGSDQPAIDTATAAIRKVTEDLAGAVTRDQST